MRRVDDIVAGEMVSLNERRQPSTEAWLVSLCVAGICWCVYLASQRAGETPKPKPPEAVDPALGYRLKSAISDIEALELRHAAAVRERSDVLQQIAADYHLTFPGDEIGPPPLFLIKRAKPEARK